MTTMTDVEPEERHRHVETLMLADEPAPLCTCGRDDRAGDHPWAYGCDDEYPMDGEVAAHAILSLPGMTYRRLDYWSNYGGVMSPDNRLPGTGRPRTFTRRDLEVCRVVLALTGAGLDLHRAFEAAVAEVDRGEHSMTTDTDNGPVTLTWRIG